MGSGGSCLPPSQSALSLFSSPSQAGMGTLVLGCARGGPCLWLYSPYLVRELHATFLAPPSVSKRQPGAERGEAGTSTHAGVGSAAAPRPCHCPSLPLGEGSPRTGTADPADGIGIACQTVGPPRAASLPATAALSGGGCPFSGSFVSAWGTHMGWGGA